MSSHRLRALVLSGGSAAILAASVIAGGGLATASDAGDVAKASNLTTAPTPGTQAIDRTYGSGEPAERRAEQLASQVPLPPGEAFDDIQWDNGDLAEVEVQGLLEANAACKWWMANADAPTEDTARIVAAIPDWPTMRTGDRHRMAEAMAPGGDPVFAAQVMRVCRAELG